MMGEREFQQVANDTKKLLEQLKARDPLSANIRSTSVPSRGDHQVRIEESGADKDRAARDRSNSKDKEKLKNQVPSRSALMKKVTRDFAIDKRAEAAVYGNGGVTGHSGLIAVNNNDLVDGRRVDGF